MSDGKAEWLVARSRKVEAKGKGTLQTYWLRHSSRRHLSLKKRDSIAPSENAVAGSSRSQSSTVCSVLGCGASSFAEACSVDVTSSADRVGHHDVRDVLDPESWSRLICWNVEMLASSLEKLASIRQTQSVTRQGRAKPLPETSDKPECDPIFELTDTLELPGFIEGVERQDVKPFVLDSEVRNQLHHYVNRIALMYRDQPFHNLYHASHVVMSASKLMNRIVVLDDVHGIQADVQNAAEGKHIDSFEDSTFGISSDPLVQFAIIFSALIRDVDHSGLTNAQLVNESADVALTYKGRSVAEQNSITVAWTMLVEPQYESLRQVIFPTNFEKKRFRQLVVTMVMATDLINSELQLLRKSRWEKAFHSRPSSINEEEDKNRKATIVVEQIIQASDVL